MKIQNKKVNSVYRPARPLFLSLVVSVFLVLGLTSFAPQVVNAEDTAANYASFNKTLGSCPRRGQPARDECVLKVAKTYVDKYCTGKTGAEQTTCNQDWTNGYLRYFAAQPNQEALKNQIGDTAINTSDTSCKQDRTGDLPGTCTQPYNTADCKDRPGSRPSYCDIPALSTDGGGAAPGSTTGNPELPVGTTKVNPDAKTSGQPCGAADQGRIDPVIDLGCKGLGNPILDIVFAFMRFLSVGAGLVIIGSMIVAGIQYTTSRGDPQATGAAIKRIVSNASALAFFVFAYAILNWLVPNGVLR